MTIVYVAFGAALILCGLRLLFPYAARGRVSDGLTSQVAEYLAGLALAVFGVVVLLHGCGVLK